MCSRLGAGHELGEQLTFTLDALVEWQVDRCFDALDVVFRCQEVASFAGDASPELVEDRWIGFGIGQFLVEVADAHERQTLGHNLLGECNGTSSQVIHDLADQAAFQSLVGTDRVTRRHHLERLGHASYTGKTLGATGTRKQAEFDFRKSKLCGGNADSVVRSHCGLEATAKGSAMDSGNNWLG